MVKNGTTYFENKAFKLQIPDKLAKSFANSEHRSIVLGVRPEDFSLHSTGKKNASSMEAIVEVIEPMGSENYLYLKTEDQNFIIKTAPSTEVKINDKIRLRVNLENIHLFDEKSSEALIN